MSIDVFTLGMTFILMHEMDAIRCHEWRIFPLTSFLNDKLGMQVFIMLHILLFYFCLQPQVYNSESFRFGFSIFLIIHLVAHVFFLLHKKNEFKYWISWSLIVGAALCGLIYLV